MACGRLLDLVLDLVQPKVDPFDPPTPKKPDHDTEHEVDRMTRCGDIANFSLCMSIFAIFLLPAEVLVTDSESNKNTRMTLYQAAI